MYFNQKNLLKRFQNFRATCTKYVSENKKKIGGVGLTVEIDESVVAKRKYHRGRLVKEQWMLGGTFLLNCCL